MKNESKINEMKKIVMIYFRKKLFNKMKNLS